MPLVTEPLHILSNGIDKNLALLLRIGVVKAKIADTTKLLCQTKIHGNRLGVTNM